MPYNVEEAIAKEKANRKRLDECPPPHNFQRHKGSLWYRCQKCGGMVVEDCYLWYEKGRKAVLKQVLQHTRSPL